MATCSTPLDAVSETEEHMKFISPRAHGALDYTVAVALVAAPLGWRFAEVSVAAAVIAMSAGAGLFLYSLLTDYAAGLRGVIPFRAHLALDATAAVAFLVAPLLLGFGGAPRAFYLAVGGAVLAVVACTRVDEAAAPARALRPSAPPSAS